MKLKFQISEPPASLAGPDIPVHEEFPRFDRRNISDEVYEFLKERIVSRQFAPGQRLNLAELERQMCISRTPLKDALKRLSVEDLVEIRPRSGTFVTAPQKSDVAEAFDVRRVLEAYAVELAIPRMTEVELTQLREIVDHLRQLVLAKNWSRIYPEYVGLDREFHQLLVQRSNNKRLFVTWQQTNLHALLARVRYRRTERELDQSQREHEAILAACEARDAVGAAKLMAQHIERAKRSLLEDMGERTLPLNSASEHK